jgi:hypothetical protein
MMRSPLSVAITFFGLFLGGAATGLCLARLLAPGSWLAEGIGAFALPVAFAVSLQAWFGLALLSVIPKLIGFLIAGTDRRPRPLARAPIPGAMVFVPVASAIGAVVGLAVGWLSTTHSVWVVAPVYWLTGTLYGLLAWRLARAGFLMPPESV